jgi:hypothetical protein
MKKSKFLEAVIAGFEIDPKQEQIEKAAMIGEKRLINLNLQIQSRKARISLMEIELSELKNNKKENEISLNKQIFNLDEGFKHWISGIHFHHEKEDDILYSISAKEEEITTTKKEIEELEKLVEIFTSEETK